MTDQNGIDRRFALLTTDGDVVYPYMKSERARGLYGFALSAPGKADRFAQGHYTEDLAEVVRRVVFDGWGVRAKSAKRPGNTLSLEKRVVKGYWIAPELRHLVHGAPTPPTERAL